MSFWGTLVGGGSNKPPSPLDGHPTTNRQRPQTTIGASSSSKSGGGPPPTNPPRSAPPTAKPPQAGPPRAIGPPPTAGAFVHSPQPNYGHHPHSPVRSPMFTAVSSPPSQPKFQIFQPPATTAAVVDQENETEQPAIPAMMMPTMTDDSVGAGGVDSSFVDGAVDNSSPTEVSSDNPKEEEQQQQTDGENGIGNDADDHIDDQEDAELETDDWDWTEETEDDDADDDDEALNNGAGQNAMVNGQETAQQMTGGVESNTHSFINPAAIAVETPQHQEPTLPSVSVPAAPSEQMVRTDNVRDPPPPLLPEPTQFTPKPPLPPTAQEQQQPSFSSTSFSSKK